jgi:hypothetical protein
MRGESYSGRRKDWWAKKSKGKAEKIKRWKRGDRWGSSIAVLP